ncbi:MAG TPA: hypothetical protein P5531_00435 [Bacteroidales bacterium]|nr:hypothetical protein [Bacteroidales bacterium]HSA42126.1 hypothetical protein [Bacteroidales bacterium]
MKKLLLLLFIFSGVISLYAGDIRLSFSALRPVNKFTQIMSAHRIGDRIYVVQSNHRTNKVMSLVIYDAGNLTLISEKTFKNTSCKEGDCIDEHFGYERTLFFKNSLILFFSSYETNKDELMLFAQRVDLDGNFVGKLVKVDHIKAKKKSNAGSFILFPNRDSTSFAIISNPPYEKYGGEKFGFKLYDTELTNTYNIALALPHKDRDVSLFDQILGNDGKIYILTKIDLEKKDRERGSAPYYYSVFTMNPDDKSILENKIDLAKRNIEDCAIRLNYDRNELVCAGFYSDLKPTAYTGGDIDGFFYQTVDVNTWKTLVTGVKKIDKKMVSELMNKKKVKEGRGISANFEILRIIPALDGSSTMIAENRFWYVTTTTTSSAGGGTSTSYTYHYHRNSIFIINIGKDGEVTSLMDIPKLQHTINDNGMFSSVLIMEKDDRIVLLYNDHPDNLISAVKTLKQTSVMGNVRKAVLVAVEIFKDGTYTKRKLSDNITTKIVLMPESGFRISGTEYCLPSMLIPAGCSCACIEIFKKKKFGLAKADF